MIFIKCLLDLYQCQDFIRSIHTWKKYELTMNRSLHLRSAKMFPLMNKIKCEMHIWLFDNRVYLFRLDFDWHNGLVYLCLRYSRYMFLEWHPVRDLFVHVNKPSISFISFSGIIIFGLLGNVYAYKFISPMTLMWLFCYR